MVPRSLTACQTSDWQEELRAAYRNVDDLLAALALQPASVPDLDRNADFRLLVPRRFAALMTPGDPTDPLLRQVLPLAVERQSCPGFSHDPVGDNLAHLGDGVLRKYAGRALWMVTHACALHCRYCFRRHWRKPGHGSAAARGKAALARIAADPSITEVILSGGDPLMLDDAMLADLIERLGRIDHVKRLRLHTRLPIVLPSRVTGTLCELLASATPSTLIVIHANHAAELGEEAATALGRLTHAGLPLLSQSVLLHGVNDQAERLVALSERLCACGVLPYYLHQLDPVQGAAHFQVSDRHALDLLEVLRERLPGYLVPRLVREIPGARSKTPLTG